MRVHFNRAVTFTWTFSGYNTCRGLSFATMVARILNESTLTKFFNFTFYQMVAKILKVVIKSRQTFES